MLLKSGSIKVSMLSLILMGVASTSLQALPLGDPTAGTLTEEQTECSADSVTTEEVDAPFTDQEFSELADFLEGIAEIGFTEYAASFGYRASSSQGGHPCWDECKRLGKLCREGKVIVKKACRAITLACIAICLGKVVVN